MKPLLSIVSLILASNVQAQWRTYVPEDKWGNPGTELMAVSAWTSSRSGQGDELQIVIPDCDGSGDHGVIIWSYDDMLSIESDIIGGEHEVYQLEVLIDGREEEWQGFGEYLDDTMLITKPVNALFKLMSANEFKLRVETLLHGHQLYTFDMTGSYSAIRKVCNL